MGRRLAKDKYIVNLSPKIWVAGAWVTKPILVTGLPKLVTGLPKIGNRVTKKLRNF